MVTPVFFRTVSISLCILFAAVTATPLAGETVTMIPPTGAPVMVERCEIAFSPGTAPLNTIKAAIAAAETQIDVAMFRLEHRGLVNALCYAARENKVRVRVLVCSEVLRDEEYVRFLPLLQMLARNGVEIHEHVNPGKLHLRCAVVDNKIVITGSANWRPETFSRKVDDVMLLESVGLAASYSHHIATLMNNGRRIFQEEPTTGEPDLLAPPVLQPERDGAMPVASVVEVPFQARVFFSPSHSGTGLLAHQIKGARAHVGLAQRWMSNPRIAEALKHAADRDVETRVMLRRDAAARRINTYQEISEHGGDVSVQLRGRAKLHLKTAVIDSRWVWTGSANGTRRAEQIDQEDMLCIDSPEVAWVYLEAMGAIENASAPLQEQAEALRQRNADRRAQQSP